MTTDILQLGAVAVIFTFAIKEFFLYLRTRKGNGGNGTSPAEREIDRRFKEVHEQINQLVAQTQNHIHTIDTKVETLSGNIVEMGREVTKLATIIDERIPKK